MLSTWILHSETDEILKTLEHLETLDSTILSEGFTGLERIYDDEENLNTRETVYPEAVLLASFFKIFDANPVASRTSRMTNLKKAVEKLRVLTKKAENSSRNLQGMEDDVEGREEPKSREQMIEEERDKGKGVIVVRFLAEN